MLPCSRMGYSKLVFIPAHWCCIISCCLWTPQCLKQGTLTEGKDQTGNPYWSGRLSTVDLLVLTSLDQLILLLKILFIFFFTKQATLMRRSTVLSLPFQLVFPARDHSFKRWRETCCLLCCHDSALTSQRRNGSSRLGYSNGDLAKKDDKRNL